MDDEYAKLVRRLNPPRVGVDNFSCEDATIIQVDSVNKHGTLLQVVQVLADMNLTIKKAYISSDGVWFMNVFYVTNSHENKIRDQEVINYIQKTIKSEVSLLPRLQESVGVMPSEEHTSIEVTGMDRPGLLSELCAVLTDLNCNVVNAEMWTHNCRAAAIVHVTDYSTGRAIIDPKRLFMIKKLLSYVLKGNNDCIQTTQMRFSPPGETHRGRRLHQIMFDDRDFGSMNTKVVHSRNEKYRKPEVSVSDCPEKDYTVIVMRSKDRPKLLFDTVCTLTDMQYVIFHGMVTSARMEAFQEFYIRHIDGRPITSEAERERVVQCLEAAIERRAFEGLVLELCTDDQLGLLSYITRIFREYGLNIRRAEITTTNGKAVDTFYVTDVTGNSVDPMIIDSIQQQIGHDILQIKHDSYHSPKPTQETTMGYLFRHFFKSPRLQYCK